MLQQRINLALTISPKLVRQKSRRLWTTYLNSWRSWMLTPSLMLQSRLMRQSHPRHKVAATRSWHQLHLNVGLHPVVTSSLCEHSVCYLIPLIDSVSVCYRWESYLYASTYNSATTDTFTATTVWWLISHSDNCMHTVPVHQTMILNASTYNNIMCMTCKWHVTASCWRNDTTFIGCR